MTGLACFVCGGTDWDVLGTVRGNADRLAIQCRSCRIAAPSDFFTFAGGQS
jgi:hypothetical protein